MKPRLAVSVCTRASKVTPLPVVSGYARPAISSSRTRTSTFPCAMAWLVLPVPFPLTDVEVYRPVTSEGETKRSAIEDVLMLAVMTSTQPLLHDAFVSLLLGQFTETVLIAAVAFELCPKAVPHNRPAILT